MHKKIFTNSWALITLLILVGAFFRLYHINFGLPHSWYADEPEFGEFAIRYAFTVRDVIAHNNWHELIPVSFVYGTFPTYFFTGLVMVYSKISGLFGVTVQKEAIYIFLRTVNAVISLTLIPTTYILYRKVFNNFSGAVFASFLIALNWKLIVQAHYLNADIIVTTLLTVAITATVLYWEKTSDSKLTWIIGISLGLAVSTKITAALTFPLFFYVFVTKKDWRGLSAIFLLIIAMFFATNPFSIILPDRLATRVLEMTTKENGMVFDSVDTNPLKYILAMSFIATPIIFLFSLYGILLNLLKRFRSSPQHVLLIGSIVLYLVFYSIGTRRVDRWILPILPIVVIYAVFGITEISSRIKNNSMKLLWKISLGIIITSYMVLPMMLLAQFQRNTPRTHAYLWASENLDPNAVKFAVTEEGLDPLNKLPNTTVKQYNVYVSDGAQFELPPDPAYFKYVFLSSRPMQNFKKPQVIKTYPAYAQKWQDFENTLNDTENFKLIKTFTVKKPKVLPLNLIPLSDIYVYENQNPVLVLMENQLPK